MGWKMTMAEILRLSFTLAAIYCFSAGFPSLCFSENGDGATNTENRGFEVSLSHRGRGCGRPFYRRHRNPEPRGAWRGSYLRATAIGKINPKPHGVPRFLYWTDRAGHGAWIMPSTS